MAELFSTLNEALSYSFMQRALIVGILIAVSSAILGVFLVLKKYSMIGDGLAHVSFATVAIALVLGASPMLVSIPIVTLASLAIMKLNDRAGLHGDAAIGLVSSFSIALGVMISSLAGGFNIDLFSYLFGSILAIKPTDMYISIILASAVVILITFFYYDLFAVTYDESFAGVIGVKIKAINYLMAVLISITIVLGIRVVGTLLISSMIVFPTVTALQLNRGFRATMLIATFVSVLSVIIGVLSSYVLNLPSGATIVFVNALFFALFLAIRVLRKG